MKYIIIMLSIIGPAYSGEPGLSFTEYSRVAEFVSRVNTAVNYVSACKNEYLKYGEAGADCITLNRKVRILKANHMLINKIDSQAVNHAISINNDWHNTFDLYQSVISEHNRLISGKFP